MCTFIADVCVGHSESGRRPIMIVIMTRAQCLAVLVAQLALTDALSDSLLVVGVGGQGDKCCTTVDERESGC